MPIAISLSEFPEDLPIYVDTNYRLILYERAHKKIKSLIGEKKMSRWKLSISNYGNLKPYCMPLGFYKKILEHLSIPLSELSDHILSYGDPRGIIVSSPKIPIINTPEFNEVVAHLLGDGSKTGRYEQKYYLPVKEFLDEVNKSFGTLMQSSKSVEILKYSKKDGRVFYYVQIPLAIMRILGHKYKMKFGTYSGKIPKDLLNGSKENLEAILRAFLIDEGNISEHVTIASYNKDILNGLSDVCKSLGINHSVYDDNITLYNREKLLSLLPFPIYHKDKLLRGYEKLKKEINILDMYLRRKRILYYIIKSRDGIKPMDLMIATNETSKFIYTLYRMIEKGLVIRKDKKYFPTGLSKEFMKQKSAREKILLEFMKKPRKVKYLVKKTGKSYPTVLQKHLWKLEKNKIVKREPAGNNEYLWFLTEEGVKIANEIIKWNKII